MHYPSIRPQFERIQKIASKVGVSVVDRNLPKPLVLFGYLTAFLACLAIVFALEFFFFKKVDIVARIPALVGLCVAIQSCFKCGHLFMMYNHFYERIDNAIEFTEKIANRPDSMDYRVCVKYHTIANRITLTLFFMYFGASIQISFSPYLTGQEFTLPVSYEIPTVDSLSHPGYEINYIYIVLQSFHACFMLVGKFFSHPLFSFSLSNSHGVKRGAITYF